MLPTSPAALQSPLRRPHRVQCRSSPTRSSSLTHLAMQRHLRQMNGAPGSPPIQAAHQGEVAGYTHWECCQQQAFLSRPGSGPLHPHTARFACTHRPDCPSPTHSTPTSKEAAAAALGGDAQPTLDQSPTQSVSARRRALAKAQVSKQTFPYALLTLCQSQTLQAASHTSTA